MDGELGRLAVILFEEGEQGLSTEFLPDLSWTDEKLRSDWLEPFLGDGHRDPLRPWLRARMPGFPAYARGLATSWRPDDLVVAEEWSHWYETEPSMVEAGARLISPLAFDCRQCHALGDLPPSGDERSQIALGINFVEIGHRLRPRYFQHWMADPLSIDPLTKMPQYSENGLTTKIETEFDGRAPEQFNAILHYLRQVARDDEASRSDRE